MAQLTPVADQIIASRRPGIGRMPDDMPRWMARTIVGIDTFSGWTGRLASWLTVPLMLGMVYEVTVRRGAKDPRPGAGHALPGGDVRPRHLCRGYRHRRRVGHHPRHHGRQNKLGFDMAWFGILVAVNLQTAWLSPPVAMSAYFLKGVVPEWQLDDIYKGMLQFMGLQLFGLMLIIAFPDIALWLPRLIYGK